MMTEISLNILDAAENSIRAKATCVAIRIAVDTAQDKLTVIVEDNGQGMTPKEASLAADPFFTTRSARKVGLGVPFFKYAAESTGGSFMLTSRPGEGTTITACFGLSHIDRMPLGDITSTMTALLACHPKVDFLYTYRYNSRSFTFDTKAFRKLLGDIPFNAFRVWTYIKEYLRENKSETDGGAAL